MKRRGFRSERQAYNNARLRCTSPKTATYERYGGRGIRFLFSTFEEFLACVGPKPSRFHVLDRIDNDGDYRPGNLRWTTRSESQNNRNGGWARTSRKMAQRMASGTVPSVLQRLIEFRLDRDLPWRNLSVAVGISTGTLQAAIRRGAIGARNARKIERFLAAVERGTALAEVQQHGG